MLKICLFLEHGMDLSKFQFFKDLNLKVMSFFFNIIQLVEIFSFIADIKINIFRIEKSKTIQLNFIALCFKFLIV